MGTFETSGWNSCYLRGYSVVLKYQVAIPSALSLLAVITTYFHLSDSLLHSLVRRLCRSEWPLCSLSFRPSCQSFWNISTGPLQCDNLFHYFLHLLLAGMPLAPPSPFLSVVSDNRILSASFSSYCPSYHPRVCPICSLLQSYLLNVCLEYSHWRSGCLHFCLSSNHLPPYSIQFCLGHYY